MQQSCAVAEDNIGGRGKKNACTHAMEGGKVVEKKAQRVSKGSKIFFLNCLLFFFAVHSKWIAAFVG